MKLRCALLALVLAPAWFAQDATAPKPIDRQGLMEAVRIGGLKPEELIGIIRDIGVDFRIQPEDEKQLAKLGADKRLIEAVRANYRGETAPPPPPIELPEGPPLTREKVILILQAGVDPQVLIDLIKLRGAAFAVDRETAAEIIAAGGNKLVVGAAVVNQRDAEPKVTPAPALAPRGVAPAPHAPKPIRVPGAEQARRLIRQTPPEYPVLAARMNLSGKVLLDIRIDASGEVTDVKVVSGHSMLSAAAVSAVRTWAYEPALVNGVPVEVLTDVEVTFSLKK